MIIKLIAVIVTILKLIMWSESSNDCNNDRIDKVMLLEIIKIKTIIGGYSNKKKIIIIKFNDN